MRRQQNAVLSGIWRLIGLLADAKDAFLQRSRGIHRSHDDGNRWLFAAFFKRSP